ncbi:MAG: NUDIX domain-containing protein [Candidatus Heimdallarchaeota archaeon]|nr:MAG: NUDIX domain-containing protein [Candidatus Heimdallarchaeota archaeon]
MSEVEKVFAYITRNNSLLVFIHPDPETGVPDPVSGIQVPGGTIKEGELPEEAVMREAFEETGLTKLKLGCFLGDNQYVYDPSVYGKEVIHHRHFFHIIFTQDTPTSWRTVEKDPSDDPGHTVLFEFYWVSLNDVIPELVAGQGLLLDKLIARMNLKKNEK